MKSVFRADNIRTGRDRRNASNSSSAQTVRNVLSIRGNPGQLALHTIHTAATEGHIRIPRRAAGSRSRVVSARVAAIREDHPNP